MPTNNDPRNPNATPDFDEWGPDTYWKLNDWLIWHDSLIKAFGQPIANDVWVEAWNSRGFFESFFDVRTDWLTFNSSFRNHLKSYTTSGGITMYDAVIDPITAYATVPVEIIQNAQGAGVNVSEAAVNISEGVKNTGKTFSWLLPTVLIVAVLIAGTILYLKFKPSISVS